MEIFILLDLLLLFRCLSFYLLMTTLFGKLSNMRNFILRMCLCVAGLILLLLVKTALMRLLLICILKLIITGLLICLMRSLSWLMLLNMLRRLLLDKLNAHFMLRLILCLLILRLILRPLVLMPRLMEIRIFLILRCLLNL